MNLADWTIQDAIAERVRQEDLVMWSKRHEQEFPLEVMRKEFPSTKWTPTAKYAFNFPLIKYVQAILP